MDDHEHLRRLSEAGVPRRLSSDMTLTLDTDSFMVGERVWVGGTLPGKIAYIGDTKFAGGDWAGVALDKPFGKHDGTVGGHQYFQCEPRHGVFSRLPRLSREPLGSPPPEWDAPPAPEWGSRRTSRASPEGSLPGSRRTSRASPEGSLPGSRKTSQVSPDGSLPGSRRVSRTSPERSLPGSRRTSRSSPGTVLPPSGRRSSSPAKVLPGRRSSSPGRGPVWLNGVSAVSSELTTARVGDRVSVNSSTTGRRLGTARYVGYTEFADGIWVGMQLDEPRGRNDGSVAGKRYFDCQLNYGLFAPIQRVALVQRRLSVDPDRRRPSSDLRRDLHTADEDGYY